MKGNKENLRRDTNEKSNELINSSPSTNRTTRITRRNFIRNITIGSITIPSIVAVVANVLDYSDKNREKKEEFNDEYKEAPLPFLMALAGKGSLTISLDLNEDLKAVNAPSTPVAQLPNQEQTGLKSEYAKPSVKGLKLIGDLEGLHYSAYAEKFPESNGIKRNPKPINGKVEFIDSHMLENQFMRSVFIKGTESNNPFIKGRIDTEYRLLKDSIKQAFEKNDIKITEDLLNELIQKNTFKNINGNDVYSIKISYLGETLAKEASSLPSDTTAKFIFESISDFERLYESSAVNGSNGYFQFDRNADNTILMDPENILRNLKQELTDVLDTKIDHNNLERKNQLEKCLRDIDECLKQTQEFLEYRKNKGIFGAPTKKNKTPIERRIALQIDFSEATRIPEFSNEIRNYSLRSILGRIQSQENYKEILDKISQLYSERITSRTQEKEEAKRNSRVLPITREEALVNEIGSIKNAYNRGSKINSIALKSLREDIKRSGFEMINQGFLVIMQELIDNDSKLLDYNIELNEDYLSQENVSGLNKEVINWYEDQKADFLDQVNYLDITGHIQGIKDRLKEIFSKDSIRIKLFDFPLLSLTLTDKLPTNEDQKKYNSFITLPLNVKLGIDSNNNLKLYSYKENNNHDFFTPDGEWIEIKDKLTSVYLARDYVSSNGEKLRKIYTSILEIDINEDITSIKFQNITKLSENEIPEIYII